MKLFYSLLFFLFVAPQIEAQNAAPEMADAFRSSGKIYVVVCVAAIVMVGLLIYLALIDRKVSKLEKDFSQKGSNSAQK
jgi:K+-transporting ATPase A subunit